MLKEARFAFKHQKCWLQDTTERYPGLTLVVSGIYILESDIHIDLLVHGPGPSVEKARGEWAKDARLRKVSKVYEGPRGTRFHVAYSSKDSIYPHILKHTPLSLSGIAMASGAEHYTVVGEPEDIDALLKDLGKEGTLKVESIRDLTGAPGASPGAPAPSEGDGDLVERWAGSMTDRQLEALILAHQEGYHRWPRQLSASELAGKLGLSNSAFLDQLRRAEAKTLEVVLAELQRRDPARFEAVRARFAKVR